MRAVGKLVRDYIPSIIAESGKSCKWRIAMDAEEKALLLARKLREEVTELTMADTKDDVIEEVADIYEVTLAIEAFRYRHTEYLVSEKFPNVVSYSDAIELVKKMMSLYVVDQIEIMAKVTEKRKERGAFSMFIVLDEVEE